MAELAASESTFVQRPIFDDAEHAYQEHLAALKKGTESVFHPRALNDHQHPHPQAHAGHFQGRHPAPHHPVHHHPQHHNYHPQHPSHSNQSHQHFQPRHLHPHRHPFPHHHPPAQHVGSGANTSIANEIAKAREQIKLTLSGLDGEGTDKFDELLKDNIELKKKMSELEKIVNELSKKVESLEKLSLAAPSTTSSSPSKPVAPATVAAASSLKPAAADDDDDDFELFESDKGAVNDDYERVKQERVKAYEEKKSKKPQLIAKSNIILSVKPWDDEVDMNKIEEYVRSIKMDGLLWGASKLVPVAYGIKALQISCVVEDDKVSTEDLEDLITAYEDYVQSMDIVAFNKI